MKLYEKYPVMRLEQILDIFTSIFVILHNWNIDDTYDKVKLSKRKYIKKFLLNAVYDDTLYSNIADKYTADEILEISLGGHIDQLVIENETWLEVVPAFEMLLGKLGKSTSDLSCCLSRSDVLLSGTPSDTDEFEDKLPEDIRTKIQNMDVPELKKKVIELTNEKIKWDKSLAIAAEIGLLFYEKGLTKPATEPAFKSEYEKWFKGIPKKTISMIYKSLPVKYRNLGVRPVEIIENAGTIDEDMVDTIMEASVAAGFITQKEGVKDFKELKERLDGDEFEVPSDNYMKRITGTCRRVAQKYK